MRLNLVSKILVGLTLLTTLATNAYAEQFLCVANKSTGFIYDENFRDWRQATFDVSSSKYIISESKNDRRYKYDSTVSYLVKEVGDDNIQSICKNEFKQPGFLFCDGVNTFRFNKLNGRYIRMFGYGYFNVLPNKNQITDQTSATPLIEIGKCSPF